MEAQLACWGKERGVNGTLSVAGSVPIALEGGCSPKPSLPICAPDHGGCLDHHGSLSRCPTRRPLPAMTVEQQPSCQGLGPLQTLGRFLFLDWKPPGNKAISTEWPLCSSSQHRPWPRPNTSPSAVKLPWEHPGVTLLPWVTSGENLPWSPFPLPEPPSESQLRMCVVGACFACSLPSRTQVRCSSRRKPGTESAQPTVLGQVSEGVRGIQKELFRIRACLL